jgi:small subunit ribosomal protein S6
MNAEYELVLMLDPEAPDERRDQLAAEARQRIESAGTLRSDSAWGMRKLAYEIQQRTEADYRFFRFQTGGSLLDDLNHNLKIADGVLRFRIFKVDPRSPVIVPPPPTPLSSGAPARGGRRGDSRRGEGPRGDRPPQGAGRDRASTRAEPAESQAGEAQPSETQPAETAPESPAPEATAAEPAAPEPTEAESAAPETAAPETAAPEPAEPAGGDEQA